MVPRAGAPVIGFTLVVLLAIGIMAYAHASRPPPTKADKLRAANRRFP